MMNFTEQHIFSRHSKKPVELPDFKCQWKMGTWKHTFVGVISLTCMCASPGPFSNFAVVSEVPQQVYDMFN